MNTTKSELVAETKKKNLQTLQDSRNRLRHAEVQGFAEFSRREKKRETEDRFNLLLRFRKVC